MTTPPSDRRTALARIHAAYTANQRSEDELAQAVDDALAAGLSLETIARDVFGITRQALWERRHRRQNRAARGQAG